MESTWVNNKNRSHTSHQGEQVTPFGWRLLPTTSRCIDKALEVFSKDTPWQARVRKEGLQCQKPFISKRLCFIALAFLAADLQLENFFGDAVLSSDRW